MNLFIPITKVDEQRREVWGVAAEEAPDKSGEIMDYGLSKPRFQEWSKSISDATQGKSLGNVRAMHQPIAAGKVISMQFDDSAKKIAVGAKIVDDNEWKKVAEGVYTGFSVGGRYGSQKYENGLLRYEAIPQEVSIVDNPCMKGATFTMVKADGMTEERPFADQEEAPAEDKPAEETPADEVAKSDGPAEGEKTPAEESTEASSESEETGDAAAETPSEGDVAKMTITLDGKPLVGHVAKLVTPATTPIADIYNQLQQHVEALGKAGARHSASDVKLIQAIHDSACSLGAGCADFGKQDDGGGLKKSDPHEEPAWRASFLSWVVSDVASALRLVSELSATMMESDPECASKLTAAVQLLTSALNDKVAEQSAATQAAMIDAVQDENLEVQLDPTGVGSAVPDEEEDMTKQFDAFKDALLGDVKALLKEFAEGATAPLQKAEQASNDLVKRFDEATARLGAFESRLDKLEKAPPAVGPVLREVGGVAAGSDDVYIASLDKLIEEEKDPAVRQALMAKRAQAAIKLTHSAGGRRI